MRHQSHSVTTQSCSIPLFYKSKLDIKDEFLDEDIHTSIGFEAKQLNRQSTVRNIQNGSQTNEYPNPWNGRSNKDTYNKNFKSNGVSSQQQQRPPRMTKSPDLVEDQLSRALDALKLTVQQQKAAAALYSGKSIGKQQQGKSDNVAIELLLFPTIRECNAALATFGDTNDLLRALQLFGKMRKSVTLHRALRHYLAVVENTNNTNTRRISNQLLPPIPAPTVVTYSTLMSRFVRADKPVVALRLWDLMLQESDNSKGSKSNQHQQSVVPIVIDVKAANILMNCYAKLANIRAAQQLLDDMKRSTKQRANNPEHSIRIMPAPNSITYNTFLSACHKSGDLDAAMTAVNDMRQLKLPMDALTYTTIIATVARKRSTIAGLYDPTPAFQFLEDMQSAGISPNGMTYSALIDACGRCRRSDLALQGLRLMLRQKQKDSMYQNRYESANTGNQTRNYTLSGEVGAWTAAINACGKAGRLETAIRLFYAMPNFGLKPNTITCGSITDSLLRAGRTADTLDILRYMKNEEIQPSEVMYTSLMSRAEKLVELERQSHRHHDRRDRPLHPPEREMHTVRKEGKASSESTKAIEVYTALMDSLINSSGKSTSIQNSRTFRDGKVPNSKTLLLLKVFLVYQEMKTANVNIDVQCYNTLLRACSQVGDVDRAQYVIRTMQREEVDPNDTSWRLLLRTAIFEKGGDIKVMKDRVDGVENIWRQALSYRESRSKRIDEAVATNQWSPSVDTFVTLISMYLRQAELLFPPISNASSTDQLVRRNLRRQYLERVVHLYENILLSRSNDGMGMNRMNIDHLLQSHRAMLAILEAVVYLEDDIRVTECDSVNIVTPIHETYDRENSNKNKSSSDSRRHQLRSMAVSILQLECFTNASNDNDNATSLPVVDQTAIKMSPSARQVLRTTRLWSQQLKERIRFK